MNEGQRVSSRSCSGEQGPAGRERSGDLASLSQPESAEGSERGPSCERRACRRRSAAPSQSAARGRDLRANRSARITRWRSHRKRCHVARLARLELSESEVTRFQEQLSAILDAVSKVSELDLSDVPPTSIRSRSRTRGPRTSRMSADARRGVRATPGPRRRPVPHPARLVVPSLVALNEMAHIRDTSVTDMAPLLCEASCRGLAAPGARGAAGEGAPAAAVGPGGIRS